VRALQLAGADGIYAVETLAYENIGAPGHVEVLLSSR
jgi:hypothetical protein